MMAFSVTAISHKQLLYQLLVSGLVMTGNIIDKSQLYLR